MDIWAAHQSCSLGFALNHDGGNHVDIHQRLDNGTAQRTAGFVYSMDLSRARGQTSIASLAINFVLDLRITFNLLSLRTSFTRLQLITEAFDLHTWLLGSYPTTSLLLVLQPQLLLIQTSLPTSWP